MTKYLLTILCSSNLELLKISFESAINQNNYSDYDIFIVINTLNENFYKEVINYCKENKHSKLKKIIRSESNGKPGKGHNSLLDIFKVEKDYEYLLILDGDDFYYPCALERINFFNENYNFDSLFLVSNSKIFKHEEEVEKNINEDNTNLSYNFNTKYNISKFVNISKIGKDFNNIIATPFRLICTNRKILEKYNKLFHENMQLYDDYYQYLLIYKLLEENNFISKNIDIKLVSDSYIYLYNKFNKFSLSNSIDLENDIKLANELKKKLNISNLDNEKLKIFPMELYLNNNMDILKKIEDIFYKWVIRKTIKISD